MYALTRFAASAMPQLKEEAAVQHCEPVGAYRKPRPTRVPRRELGEAVVGAGTPTPRWIGGNKEPGRRPAEATERATKVTPGFARIAAAMLQTKLPGASGRLSAAVLSGLDRCLRL
jgi:hypothetical protein